MAKSNFFTIVANFLLGLFIFLVPSNLFYKFVNSSAYVNGILSDYLIPKIYVNDLVTISLFFLLLTLTTFNKKKLLFILGGGLLVIFWSGVSQNFLASFWFLLKVWMLAMMVWLVNINKNIFYRSTITTSLLLTIIFQGIFGIAQYGFQKSLTPYRLLGETNLANVVNIAHQESQGQIKILPYGTTAHPNIWAGVIVIYFILLININRSIKPMLVIASSLFVLFCTLLSGSLSAFLSLLIGLFFYLANQKLSVLIILWLFFLFSPLLIFQLNQVYSSDSLYRRHQLNLVSLQILKNHPWWGTGINAFTSAWPPQFSTRDQARFIQPVHHAGLLLLSELGVFGPILILILIRKYFQFSIFNFQLLILNLSFLLPILSLDHYLVSLQVGLMLWVVIILANQKFMAER